MLTIEGRPFLWIISVSNKHTFRWNLPSYSLDGFTRVMRQNSRSKRYKVWVCGRSLAGVAGLNPAGGMEVCLLRLMYVVR